VRFRVDDRACFTQPRDERAVVRREVGRVVDVAASRRAHVLRVVDGLERDDGAVQRHRREIGIPAVHLVELGRVFDRVGLLAELLALGRRSAR
jgi:hypothetical protein